MNGQHIPGTPMVVDYWKTKNLPPRLLFFLTHMHADHTSGLNSTWPHPIHCTPVTAKLLKRKFKINPKLVVELELGAPTLLHVTSPWTHTRVTITVTAIDANHCPGSAMFLFEGYFGRILYTGDFRYCAEMSSNPLLDQSRHIDILYLDNTYCDTSCVFPTREEAASEIISLVQSNQYRVYIGLHTLGKEDLLVRIATSLNCRVGVEPERMEQLQLLEVPDVFSTEVDDCWVRVRPFHIIAKNYIKDEEALFILPTSLYTGAGAPPLPAHVKVVPYSDHSSYSELCTFVRLLSPSCVRPIVQDFTGERGTIRATRNNMAVFNHLLDTTSTSVTFDIPSPMQELLSRATPKSGPKRRKSSPNSEGSGGRHSRLRSASGRMRQRGRGVQFISPCKENIPSPSPPPSFHPPSIPSLIHPLSPPPLPSSCVTAIPPVHSPSPPPLSSPSSPPLQSISEDPSCRVFVHHPPSPPPPSLPPQKHPPSPPPPSLPPQKHPPSPPPPSLPYHSSPPPSSLPQEHLPPLPLPLWSPPQPSTCSRAVPVHLLNIRNTGSEQYSHSNCNGSYELCECALCLADLADYCIESHQVESCHCRQCMWGIHHFFYCS